MLNRWSEAATCWKQWICCHVRQWQYKKLIDDLFITNYIHNPVFQFKRWQKCKKTVSLSLPWGTFGNSLLMTDNATVRENCVIETIQCHRISIVTESRKACITITCWRDFFISRKTTPIGDREKIVKMTCQHIVQFVSHLQAVIFDKFMLNFKYYFCNGIYEELD